MDIAHKLHKLVYLLDRHAEELLQSKMNITYSQFLILLALKHAISNNQFDISKALCVTPSAVSRHVDNLAKLKLVSRQESDKNRRTNEIVLTPKGETVFSKAFKLLDKQMSILMKDFSNKKKLNFQGYLDLMINSFECNGECNS